MKASNICFLTNFIKLPNLRRTHDNSALAQAGLKYKIEIVNSNKVLTGRQINGPKPGLPVRKSLGPIYNNMKLILTTSFILVVFACTTTDHKQKSTNDIGQEDLNKIPNDTFVASGKVVVFFSISQPEYNLLSKDTNSGIDEVLSDFNYYSGIVADSIKTIGFKSIMTASRFIKIILNDNATKTFDRLADKENVTGYILSNGKNEPIIEYGISTDQDFLSTFNHFRQK